MEQNEIIEGNKLIAEFMEVDYEDAFTLDIHECTIPLINALTYHSSWDELMPVVQKIEELGYETNLHNQFVETNGIKHNYHMFEIDTETHTVAESFMISAKSAVWQAVVQFIKWYNQSQTLNCTENQNSNH